MAWVDSGLPDSTFNYVYRAPTSQAEFAIAVAAAQDHFRRRQLPFHWSVGLRPEPTRAAATLAGRGLRFDYAEPAMRLDLNALPKPAPHGHGLQIRRVADTAMLRTWMQTWGCGAPDEVIERWYRVYAALPYDSDGVLRLFISTLANEPVATVYLHITGRIATVHYVVTRHEFRRRGIGTAMTKHALREARAADCRVAVLTASALGANIYRRLGFRETGLVSNYLWTPDAEAHNVIEHVAR